MEAVTTGRTAVEALSGRTRIDIAHWASCEMVGLLVTVMTPELISLRAIRLLRSFMFKL